MDVKTIGLIFLGSSLFQASIFGVAADKVPDKDGEVPKLAKEGNQETAAVRGLSPKNMILQKRSMKEDIKENRQKRAGKEQTRQEDKPCTVWIDGECLYGKEDIKENRQKRAGKVQTRQDWGCGWSCSWCVNGACWDRKLSELTRHEDIKENRQKRAGKAQTRQDWGCGFSCSWCVNDACWDRKLSELTRQEDIKENRPKRAGKAQTRQED